MEEELRQFKQNLNSCYVSDQDQINPSNQAANQPDNLKKSKTVLEQ